MAIPAVTITVTDGALGLVGADTSANTLLVGTCSAGTANTVYQYSGSDAIDTMRTDLGYGPLAEAAAYHLQKNGSPIACVPVTVTVTGSNSAVTLTGTSPTVSLSGTPLDDFQGKVLVSTAGTLTGMGFKYSLDNGTTYSGEILQAGATTYTIPNSGLTLQFATGSYVANDYYTFTTTAPYYSTTDLATAITAGANSTFVFSLLHVVGRPNGTTDTLKSTQFATVCAAVETSLDTLATNYRYVRAVVDGPLVAANTTSDGLIATAIASVAAARVIPVAGQCTLVSAISSRQYSRPAAWPVVSRARQVVPSEHLGYVGRGNLGNEIKAIDTDARLRSTLDANRCTTLRTHIGKAGFYVTRPLSLAQSGSDFAELHSGRVIDLACSTGYTALLDFLNSSVRVNATTGTILEADARAIEAVVGSALSNAITTPGYASLVAVTVNRSDNILSTQKLRVKIRVTPLGYAEQITAEIGFSNPALQVVTA